VDVVFSVCLYKKHDVLMEFADGPQRPYSFTNKESGNELVSGLVV
jgi:hypothetical protein